MNTHQKYHSAIERAANQKMCGGISKNVSKSPLDENFKTLIPKWINSQSHTISEYAF